MNTPAPETTPASETTPTSAPAPKPVPCPRCGNPLALVDGCTTLLCRACLLDSVFDMEDAPGDDDAPGAPRGAPPHFALPPFGAGAPFGTRAPFDPAPAGEPGAFGHFAIEEEIGRGGMGIVYRAREYASNRLVALKMMHLFHLQTPEMLRRFETEVRAVAALDHPGIMPVYEVGQHDGIPFFSMKLAERGSLASVSATYNNRPRDAAALMATLARAMHHAHQRGVIHRDLKPGNILLDAAGQPYISDFGIARIIDAQGAAARATQTLGTPGYLAPEIMLGGPAGQITTAVDIYGLGAILYELLTGAPPAAGATPAEVFAQLAKGPPPPPRALNPAIPRDLSAVCMKCLSREPADRYDNALALANDLENWLDARPVNARPPGAPGQFARFCRRQPVLASLGAATLLLILALATVSTTSAIRTASQRDRALAAERAAQDELHKSLLMQARLGRQTGQAGHRFDGLDALRQAAAIRITPELRNEAAALLTLTDMRAERTFTPRESPNHPIVFDNNLERYLVCVTKDNALSLRRFPDNTEIAAYPGTTRNILSLSPFSADGRYVASRHYDGPIRVWDTREHRLAFELPARLPRNRPYQSVRFWYGCAFSRDGKLAAIELPEGGYTLHDTADSGRELARFPGKPSAYALAFDNTGNRLAIADRGARLVEIRDTLTGKTLHRLEHPAEVFCLEWSPDGDSLATGCNDALIHIWDTATGQPHRILDGHRNRVTHLAYTHDGRLLAATSQERNITLWDPMTGRRLVSYPDAGHEPTLRFSRDDTRLVSTNFQTTATLFEIVTDNEICRTFAPKGRSHNSVLTASVDFSPDSRWLVTTTRRLSSLWDLPRHRLAAEIPHDDDTETSALFTPAGDALLVASRAKGLTRYPLAPATNANPLGPPQILMRDPGYTLSDFGHSRAHPLLTNRAAAAALLWPIAPGAQPRRYTVQTEPIDAALSPDNKTLATTSAGQSSGPASKKLHLWDTATGAKLAELDGGDGGLVRYTPDGLRLLATSRHHFALWDAATLAPLPGAPKCDMSDGCCLSPDGRYLCVSGDGKVTLYQGAGYGEPVLQLTPAGNRVSGSRMVFDGAGELLAVHESDGTVRIWSLPRLRAALTTRGLDWRDE